MVAFQFTMTYSQHFTNIVAKMESTFKYLFLMLILVRCNTDKSEGLQVPKDLNLSLSELSLDNPKVVSTIKEYIDGNKDGSPRIYTMLVQRENILTTSFQLCAINTYSELHQLIPS